MRRLRESFGSRLALSLLLLSTSALADAEGTPKLEYQAPSVCPSRLDFSALVTARTRSWLAPSLPLTVMVEIEPLGDAEGFVGEVKLLRGERETVRRLSATRCDELVRALALIVAIVIDPQAGQPPAAPVAAPYAPRPPEVPPRRELRLAAKPWWIVGAEAVLETAVTNEPNFGERLFVGMGRGDAPLWLSSSRLSLSRVFSHATSPESGARAEFELLTVRGEGCVFRAVKGWLGVEPCVFFGAGRLRALGLHPAGDVTRDEPWLTGGVLLRPTLTFARRIVLGGELGLQVPLTRYRFAFTGERSLEQTAVVGVQAALGLGVRFP